jgi:hypothetical protein
MNERPSDANSFQYERPNRKWVCGKASCGQACRLGPDSHGHCRVTSECQPALETKPGEAKGRYRCTLPSEYGGPCPGGPLPDGSCCRPLIRCIPVRSLRAKRSVFTFSAVILTTAWLLAAFGGPSRWEFISPGALSKEHSTPVFARLAKQQARDNCAVCHNAARGGMATWFAAAVTARPAPWQMRALAKSKPAGMTDIDRNCLDCHQGHSFHEPNVPEDRSCSLCHVEHQGPDPMRAPADAGCLSCHADAALMQAALTKAAGLPAAAFDYRPARGRAVFHAPRPRDGYTRLIHGFATDHPEFQIIAEKLTDPDTLRFNHELHLGSRHVSAMQARLLTCADCHQLNATGDHFLKISYEQNCRPCHSLQFDVRNPGLRLPHGDAEHVRAFLRSLPQQYADYAPATRQYAQYAAATLAAGGRPRVEDFAAGQIALLRADVGSGEELERRVFFSDARWTPVSGPGGATVLGPALFPSCAYCHEVKSAADGAPLVTHPVIPDRWMSRGEFDHSKHLVSANRAGGKILCSECHPAERSRLTSDVLLPSRQICVDCHGPRGGVSDGCSTCHSYHSVRKEAVAAR